MIGQTQTENLLKRVLALSSADETEVVLLGLDEQLTRFANNAIHQHVAEANRYVIVRAALGKRVGVSATNDLSDAGLERAVENAVIAARALPENPDFTGLPEPTDIPAVVAFDEATAACTPAERARAVSAVCRKAEEAGCLAAGAFRTSVYEWAVANSHGLFAYHPVTAADLTVVVMTDDSSGYAADASWKVAEIDVAARGDVAIQKALCSRNPQTLEPGVYPVVLEPYAAHDVVGTLAVAAGATFVQEGRSWLTGRQGQQLMVPLFPIYFVRTVRAPDAWIGTINSVQTFVMLFGYFFWARQGRTRGSRSVPLWTTAGLALYPALAAATGRVELIAAFAGLAGFFLAGVNLVFFDELMKTVPVEHSATFVSVAQSLQYLSSVVAPLAGTTLADHAGIYAALVVSTLVRLAGFGLFAARKR
jgi:hypothetical protein